MSGDPEKQEASTTMTTIAPSTTNTTTQPMSDEEQLLRERLKTTQQSRRKDDSKMDQEEERLRSKLKEKLEARRGGSDRGGASPRGSSHNSNSRGRSRSRDRKEHRSHRRHRHHHRHGRARTDIRRPSNDYYAGTGSRGPPPPHLYHPPLPPTGGYHPPHDPHAPPKPPPPRGYRDGRRHRRPYEELDDFGRVRRPRSRSVSRTRSNSHNSRSTRSDDDSDDASSPSRSRSRSRRRGRSRSASTSSSSFSSRSSSASASSSGEDGSSRSSRSSASSAENGSPQAKDSKISNDPLTKDQRTVFVNQLVIRTTERDIKKYFKSKTLSVNQVILLRDKRTGRHKGCAYVELRRLEDVPTAVALSGQVPSFQRFPILVKPSQAEKNYAAAAATATTTISAPTAAAAAAAAKIPPLVGPNGKILESQRVYVGSLDPSVTASHLQALFGPFGQLLKVALQTDPAHNYISKGFAFLTFRDPREANLAIQTMSGQILAGRPIKTGWANHVSNTNTIEIVQSDEFPPNASTRAQQAFAILAQWSAGVAVVPAAVTALAAPGVLPGMAAGVPIMAGGVPTTILGVPFVLPTMPAAGQTVAAPAPSNRIGTVAEARASLAAATNNVAPPPPPDATIVGGKPTPLLLVHNMYDRDQETEPGWEEEIRQEFQEECSKFGTIVTVKVLSHEPGGKIACKFDTVQGAQNCAANLAGRWFDKRQLRVGFISELP